MERRERSEVPARRAVVPVVCARLRMPLVWLGMAGIVGAVAGLDAVAIVGPVVLVLGLAMYFRVGTVRAVPEEVVVPVAGRWTALNSPASWVPSYGLHAYGQTYAIDLVHEPLDRTRPAFGWRPLSLPPASFPAFGSTCSLPWEAWWCGPMIASGTIGAATLGLPWGSSWSKGCSGSCSGRPGSSATTW